MDRVDLDAGQHYGTITVAHYGGSTSIFVYIDVPPPPAPYWRRNIEIGDILLCRSYSYLGCLLSQLGHFWTHAGIYVGDIDNDGIGEVVEAISGGVKPQDITFWDYNDDTTTWDDTSKTCVELLRVTSATTGQRIEAAQWARAQIGKGFWLNPIGKRDNWDNSNWYCSELVWAAYKSQGINIEHKPDLYAIVPQEINDDDDVKVVNSHRELDPPMQGCLKAATIFFLYSPADMIVTDPDGLTISKEVNQIPEAFYMIEDVNDNGDPKDFVFIPELKLGDYQITVIPEPDALPTDTYTLKAQTGDATTILVENALISDVPTQPYILTAKIPTTSGGNLNMVVIIVPTVFAILLGTALVYFIRRKHRQQEAK